MASMGPPLISGGNRAADAHFLNGVLWASMGPPLISGGNKAMQEYRAASRSLQWGRR